MGLAGCRSVAEIGPERSSRVRRSLLICSPRRMRRARRRMRRRRGRACAPPDAMNRLRPHERRPSQVPAERAGHPDPLGQPDGRPARRRRRRRCTPAPSSRPARTTWRRYSRWPDPPGGLARAGDRDPRAGPRRLQAVAPRRRSTVRGGWSASSIRPPTSTTSTRAARRPGSHKPNTAVAQAYENAAAGISKLTTETGAGQWGSALAFACQLFGLECEVWMVGSSYDQKPYRRSMMETWGATVHRSPSDVTASGRAQRAHPTGSLGIAISEAVEVAAQRADTNYSLGSVLNHVLLHQTVIGQEALAQMALAGEEPDVVVACVGGGSNFGGLTFPFLRRVIRGERQDAVRRRRARGVPDADPRRLRLRLRRHGRADPADADVHARPRLRASACPRRRPALPRRFAARVRAGQGRARRGRAPTARTRRSRRRSGSPVPRG